MAEIFGSRTLPHQEELASIEWSSLPTPLAAAIFDLLSSDAKQGSVLATVTSSWHLHILGNHRFRELFDCRAAALVASLKADHLHSLTSKSAPYSVATFMKIWLDLQFPAIVPYSAWRGTSPEQPNPSHADGKAVFLDVKKRLAAKEQIFHTALTLNRLSQWMNTEETVIDKVNGVTVIFLVPQGLFWLALHADGWVSSGDVVGRICGLSACIGGAACTTCAVACQVHILHLKHRLWRQLSAKQHQHTLPTHGARAPAVTPGLLRDRCEILNLFRCACWSCIILVAAWWLAFQASVAQILVAFTVLSSLLSIAAIGLWLCLQRNKSHFPSLFKLWFAHQWAMTPFFASFALAQFVTGWWQLFFVILAAVAPSAVLIVDAVLLIRSRPAGRMSLDDVCGVATMLGILVVVVGGLAILCGRCVRASWALAVPVTLLTLPVQLPLVAIVISVAAGCCVRLCCESRKLCRTFLMRCLQVLPWPRASRHSSKQNGVMPSASANL